jgi:hypothetical protein
VALTEELLRRVANLRADSRKEAFRLIGENEWRSCQDDPSYWLDSSRHVKTREWPEGLPYVFTKDPHLLYECKQCLMEVMPAKRAFHAQEAHQVQVDKPRELDQLYRELPAMRPFPQLLLKEYMLPIIDQWAHCQFMVLEKSRDMMASWLFVALHTWDVMFHKGRQHIFQSQNADKTRELVLRAQCIYDNMPKFLREAIGPASYAHGNSKSGELIFEKQESEILGFPQGPEQIRQYHPSGIFTDETAFQVYAESGFAAIKPAIQQGGRYTGISSANRSFFERLCRDQND